MKSITTQRKIANKAAKAIKELTRTNFLDVPIEQLTAKQKSYVSGSIDNLERLIKGLGFELTKKYSVVRKTTDTSKNSRIEALKAIVKAYKDGSIKLTGSGTKAWFGYQLKIAKLTWGVHKIDGYQIKVIAAYRTPQQTEIGTITIDSPTKKVSIEY